MTEEPVTKDRLLAWMQEERRALEETIGELDEAQMVRPGLEGGWTVKDVLAHIVAWEQLMCRWLQEAIAGQVPDRPGDSDDIDRRNEAIYEANRERPLAEVLEDFARSYQRSLEVVRGLPEEPLFDADYYAWREGNPLWYMVGGNTFWHYKEHNKAIREWMAASGIG